MMKSYYECIEELDSLAGEIYRDHGEPDYAIPADGLNIEGGLTRGRLLYRPGTASEAELKPALEFTVSNALSGFHRYSLSRIGNIVLAQSYGISPRKSDVRKPREYDDLQAFKDIDRTMAFKIMTVTGLRRLASDMVEFKEKSALPTL